MIRHPLQTLSLALALGGLVAGPRLLHAQDQRGAVMAVVDSAMHFINTGEVARLSDLMAPEAQVYAASTRSGQPGYRMRTAESQRAAGRRDPIIERGFAPDVRIAGTIAVVWLPYDLYVDNAWSHCGVDVFTLVLVGDRWRIANLTYSIEQPPACRVHPSGPAPGTRGTPPAP
jgi:hypothetical protein